MSNLLFVNLRHLKTIPVKAIGIKISLQDCVFIGLFAILGYHPVYGEIDSRAGTEEFSFVSVSPYARPAGLAGAYTALAQGMDAVSSNPAGLAMQKKGNWASIGFKKNILDVNSGELTHLFSDNRGLHYAASIHYINYGSIGYRDENNQNLGSDLHPMSFNPSFTAAYGWQKKVRAGATVKIPLEYLGDFQGSRMALGWGTDLGVQYQPSLKRIKLGAALVNMGRKERSQQSENKSTGLLPAEFKGGFVYQGLGSRKNLFSLDLGVPWHNHTYTSLGFEYSFSRYVIFRTGTRWNLDEIETYFREFVLNENLPPPGKNDLKLAAGLTLRQKRWSMDYAVQWWQNLGFQHWVTLKVKV